ncbi:MAG: molybdenum cofactor guanylyltransferase [Candidatus Limnocylindrales bacterium]
MSADPSVSGIVLAGGSARRFGADKLTVELRGRPLLHHAMLALAEACDELVVTVAAGAAPPLLPVDLAIPLVVVHDATADAGPLAGLAAGLECARGSVALVVAGDQPDLRPALLRTLRGALGTAAAAILADGLMPRSLPAALRREPALAAARVALGSADRSLLGLIVGLEPVIVPEAAWRAVDPHGDWRRDVDRPEDLPG